MTAWVDCFLQSKGVSVAGNQVALDGKAQRGSRTGDGSSVQLVSAWLVEAGGVLGSEAIDDKSNEIRAIPSLIKALDLRGATVTLDAMGCQRAIVEEIQSAGADYIVQVKGNQPGLQEECRAVAVEVSKPGRGTLDADKVELHREVDKGHGRVETRVCHLVRDLDLVTRREMWSGLSAVAVVSRERHEMATGKVSGDLAPYLVSSETASAETIAQQIRAHWSVENSLHWCLDMTWGEDAHRARDRQGAANLGRLRRMVASMTKQSVGDGMSGRRVTGKCQRAPDHILRILRGEKISRPARRRPNRSKVGRFGQGTGKRNKGNPTE